MLKMKKWFTLVFLFFCFTSTYAADTGELLPKFSLPTLNGGYLSNKNFAGKVALLNVWASWCKYCNYEHDMLLKIKKTSHVPIYGILLKDTAQDAKDYLSRNGNPYVTVGEDPLGTFANELGVYGTPQTFVIDKKGKVRYQHHGSLDETTWNRTLKPLIQQLENEKA